MKNLKHVVAYTALVVTSSVLLYLLALVWIHDHTTEAQDTLWSTKGSGHMGKPVTRTNADGVRKLSLCLDNGLTGPAFLSGYARILVED